MYKPRRAKASYTRRYAHAELSTTDRNTSVQAKLFENGNFLFEITRGDQTERHELKAKQEAHALAKLIRKVERTFDGDSNDAEHDATVELVDYLKERLASRPRVVVVCDGGLVQDVLSTVPVDWAMIDYDVEGADLDRLTDIPQTEEANGQTAKAYAYTAEADVLPERTNELFNAINPPEVSDATQN